MFYFDESGFSLTPVTPYAWQKGRRVLTVPKACKKRINVAGFWSRQGHFLYFQQQENLSREDIIQAFEILSRNLARPTIVVLDNASWHTSKALMDCTRKWERRGLLLYFLPPYSPELNRIELLWKKIKCEWLPLTAWQSWSTFAEELQNVLDGIGLKYKLTYV